MRLASCLDPIKLARLSGRDVILLFVSFLGCVPTCEQVCEKLTQCESLDSVTTEKRMPIRLYRPRAVVRRLGR